MATTWKTITVRVERPPEASLGDFFAVMRSWLDHHCIMLADFKGITLPNKSGVFDALFDNPRDALLFGRRFGAQPTGNVPARIASRRPFGATAASIERSRASIQAAIAGGMRSVLRIRTKLYQSAGSATV
ncbi:MAG TPA: hypothetical protein VN900_03920 [Stellaceae bacterium]|jgi:hypothetical protein|nr:hypothetical protein [Stellaceae bacterium]